MRIAINGFGRIGRVLTRVILQEKNIEIVGINDVSDLKSLANLFKYDSTHGVFKGDVSFSNNKLKIDDREISFFQSPNRYDLPWEELNVDLVVEATGKCKTRKDAEEHIKAGAKRVVISAPVDDSSIPTLVIGVNDHLINAEEKIWSNASCTTNNAAPMVQVIHENFGIESCYITTVHSYTGDQRLTDAPHKDLRRARSATQSIVPTTTGAAKALTKIFPDLNEVIGGCGIRVPVIDGSLTDITCIVKDKTTEEEVKNIFKKMAAERYKNILYYSEEPLVSVDIIGNSYSCVFDAELTSVIGNMVKVVGWYDNEVGYSNRLKDLINLIAAL